MKFGIDISAEYDKIEEMVFETNAEDIENTENYIKIITSIEDFHQIEKFLEEKWIEFIETKLDFVPDNYSEITDFDNALKFKKMMEAFDEDEDVSLVSSNEIISDSLDAEVEEFISKNKFSTKKKFIPRKFNIRLLYSNLFSIKTYTW